MSPSKRRASARAFGATGVLRGTLTGGLLLVALGSTAWADPAAWVLWSEHETWGGMGDHSYQSIGLGGNKWTALDAYISREGCRDALRAAVRKERAVTKDAAPSVETNGPVVTVTAEFPGAGGWSRIRSVARFACWPAGHRP